MKHSLLSLLIIPTVLIACNSGNMVHDNPNSASYNLKIINGNEFSKLPENTEIKTLSEATIGLQIKNLSGGVNRCTGVAIAENLLLTAQHCFVDWGNNETLPGKIITTAGDQITLNVINSNPTVATVESIGYATDDVESLLDFSGNDLTLVKLTTNTFPKFVPIKQIISFQNYDKSAVVDELANKLWDRKNTLYTMGWGSNLKFEFITIDSESTKFPYNFKQSLIINGKLVNSYNNEYSIWQFDPDEYQTNKFNTTNPESASLSNILISRMDEIQQGDSGGPTFTCDMSGNNCFLIGITSAIHEYEDEDYADVIEMADTITLANPFYEKIYNEIKLTH